MKWIRIWVHLVFPTQNREPLLSSTEMRRELFDHIKQSALTNQIWIDSINGYKEHLHCLISLGKSQHIEEVVQVIKTGSAEWMNDKGINEQPFQWQDDYWAVSVSESRLQDIRNQIENQEKHHTEVTFDKELELFLQEFDNAWIVNHSGSII